MTIQIMKMTVMMRNMLIAVAFVKLFFDPMKKQMIISLTILDAKNVMFVSITNSSGKIMSNVTYFSYSTVFSKIVNCEL